MARRVALIIACLLVGSLFVLTSIPPSVSASLCQRGWVNKGSWTNSFTYDSGGKKVVWSGSVTLYVYQDGNCFYTSISIVYGVGGGSVTLRKTSQSYTVFISFTIQYPSSFSNYDNVWMNRIGDLYSQNPAPGVYNGYTVEKYDTTNSDEFIIVTDDTTQHTISSVTADFRLTTCGGQSCLGKTVYAQIHAGYNLYNKVIAINIPT